MLSRIALDPVGLGRLLRVQAETNKQTALACCGLDVIELDRVDGF